MACAPLVLGQRCLTEGKQASRWEVSGRRRACSRAADRTARHRGGSALINEGIWKTISRSRFAFNYLINQNSFNSMCNTLCTKTSAEALCIRAGTACLSTGGKRGGAVYKIQTLFLLTTRGFTQAEAAEFKPIEAHSLWTVCKYGLYIKLRD